MEACFAVMVCVIEILKQFSTFVCRLLTLGVNPVNSPILWEVFNDVSQKIHLFFGSCWCFLNSLYFTKTK